ncbi:dihydropteroate synthase [Paraliobacillus ryukyuensis]|uniref:Dihydropteroate synthase n=1 Tax=Paraliobacillus ryukyuensis TaxID=200904 RepID=A0A366DM19_9BACI|nr:dihydropteroate synthase [Paraliobacillus ryukyuensis]RBO91137.1 dihydropteroate synthase [Paraliobacillus ryukyuensis]
MNRIITTKQGKLDLDQKTMIMGILNVTPDSFSDGGKFNHVDKAVEQAKKMVQAGADMIDIGGESTRPGHTPVSVEEELSRVIPIIKAVRAVLSVPISIDTYKSDTAKQAIEAGADIINDVWGAKYDEQIAKVAADHQVPLILMHNRKEPNYQHFVMDMLADLKTSVAIAKRNGVSAEQIILDPGIGFAKTLEQNLEAMRALDQIAAMGYPVLLGTSRKSMVAKVTNLPVDQRDEATGATTCYGITKGVDLVRVHNVTMTTRMTKMMDAMVGKGVIEVG